MMFPKEGEDAIAVEILDMQAFDDASIVRAGRKTHDDAEVITQGDYTHDAFDVLLKGNANNDFVDFLAFKNFGYLTDGA